MATAIKISIYQGDDDNEEDIDGDDKNDKYEKVVSTFLYLEILN